MVGCGKPAESLKPRNCLKEGRGERGRRGSGREGKNCRERTVVKGEIGRTRWSSVQCARGDCRMGRELRVGGGNDGLATVGV